jgi:hypothetical protein
VRFDLDELIAWLDNTKVNPRPVAHPALTGTVADEKSLGPGVPVGGCSSDRAE